MKKKTITYYEGYRVIKLKGMKKFRVPVYKKCLEDDLEFFDMQDLLEYCKGLYEKE